VILCLVALFTAKAVGNRVELDLTTVPRVRRELAVAALTFGLGILIAFLTSATFQSRYAAVIVPLLLIASAAGVAVLPEKARLVTGALVIGLSLLGIGWTEYFQRTQSADVAAQVKANMQPGDVVVYCPDQLGPDYSREMPDGLVELAYPTLDPPERVDWVDYAERNAAADPIALADEVRRRAGDHDIYVVWKAEYLTFGQQCEQFLHEVGRGRTFQNVVTQDGGKYYEPANLTWLAAAS
jgi:mannosyltransferase